ncbi:MAG TPA: NAD(P)-binding domain-containing protein [Actinomycetota bacterium]|nr:NAD(P)-binding domain-containing protein [Actinomycetota bacterium]
MQVGIVGTATVGRTLAQGFTQKGHDVVIGTRDVEALMARTERDAMGNPPFAQWKAEHPEIGLTTQVDAMAYGEIVVNATDGEASEAALSAGGEHLTGTIVLDASNPIDHASGWPPGLFVANTDSLGERLQAALPQARFVKVWNTMTAALMTDPGVLAGGDHTIPLCGNDAHAKAEVSAILESFGWRDILDLGDITAARAMEAHLLIWLRELGALDTAMFNTKVVR